MRKSLTLISIFFAVIISSFIFLGAKNAFAYYKFTEELKVWSSQINDFNSNGEGKSRAEIYQDYQKALNSSADKQKLEGTARQNYIDKGNKALDEYENGTLEKHYVAEAAYEESYNKAWNDYVSKQPGWDPKNLTSEQGEQAYNYAKPIGEKASEEAYKNAAPGNTIGANQASTNAYNNWLKLHPGDFTGAKKAATEAYKAYSASCGLTNLSQCGKDFIAIFAVGILKLSALVLFIGGKILNEILQYTVTNMSSNLQGTKDAAGIISGGMPGIDIAWGKIRDLANMAFIFVLLYIAINTILQTNTGKIKGLLAKVIMVALLLNFSMLFTKVIIDVSNIVTLTFYNNILTSGKLPKEQTANTLGGNEKPGLSDAFMDQLRLGSLYSSPFADNSNGAEVSYDNLRTQLDWGKVFVFGIMGSAFMLVTAFVFFSVAILFVIRYVVLIILIILSPIAFVSQIIPSMEGNGKKWWSTLFGQCMFAPMYMIMTWLTLSILAGITQGLSNGNMIEALKNSGGSVSIFVNFAIVICIAIASLVIAKSTSASAAGTMVSKVAGTIAGVGVATTAALSRRTVGWTANKVASSETLRNATSSDSWLARNVAKATLIGADKTRKSSFDLRNSKTAGWVAKQADINMGKPKYGKDGYVGVLKAQDKTAEERAKLYGSQSEEAKRRKGDKKEKLEAEKKKVENDLNNEMAPLEKKMKDEETALVNTLDTLTVDIKTVNDKIENELKPQEDAIKAAERDGTATPDEIIKMKNDLETERQKKRGKTNIDDLEQRKTNTDDQLARQQNEIKKFSKDKEEERIKRTKEVREKMAKEGILDKDNLKEEVGKKETETQQAIEKYKKENEEKLRTGKLNRKEYNNKIKELEEKSAKQYEQSMKDIAGGQPRREALAKRYEKSWFRSRRIMADKLRNPDKDQKKKAKDAVEWLKELTGGEEKTAEEAPKEEAPKP